MKFSRAQPTINFPIARYLSESGRWELGLTPMLFGVRVRAGLVGNQWCEIDYCAGAELSFQVQLLIVVRLILEALPENVSPGELQELMPSCERKPIDRDPCWDKLVELAGRLHREKEVAA